MTQVTHTPSGKFQVPYDLMEAQQRIERLDQYQMKGGGVISVDRSRTMAMGDHYQFRLRGAGWMPYVEAWIDGTIEEQSSTLCQVQIKQSRVLGDWLQGIASTIVLSIVISIAAIAYFDASLIKLLILWIVAVAIIGLYAMVLVGNLRQQQELVRNFVLIMTGKDPDTIREIVQ